MLDKSKVIVVSSETWEMMMDKIVEGALVDSNPIGYVGMLNGVDIIIDDELPYNVAEVYERWMYDAILKYGKKKD